MASIGNLRRLQNEVRKYEQSTSDYKDYFELNMVCDDMYHWEAMIYGQEDSLYYGYKFKIDIKLPDDYPYSPPNVKFITPILHVNINKHGDICLDILKKAWSSSQTICTVIMSIISLLNEPNMDDPFNHELIEIYKKNKDKYLKQIKNHCEKHKI